jgi:hypothetical protein
MSDKQRRLASLEAASSDNWTPWAHVIWDPRTGETLAEAKVRQLGPDWRGNTIVHRIVDPKPRPEMETDQ